MNDYDREARAALTSEANPFNAESIIRHHKARAEAAEKREQDLIEDLRVALVERDAAEAKVARVEVLIRHYDVQFPPITLYSSAIAQDFRRALTDEETTDE